MPSPDEGKAPLRVFIHLPYGLDRTKYKEQYLAGLQPDESPYGFHWAESIPGMRIDYSVDYTGSRPFETFRKATRKILDFDIIHAWQNRNILRKAEFVWTVTEGEAFAVACLKKFGIVKDLRIIANAVWLLNRWSDLSPARRIFLQRLVRQFDVLTVHSAACVQVAAEIFSSVPIRLLPFGINAEMFKLQPQQQFFASRPLKIFSAGNDRTRDFATIIETFGGRPDYEVTLFCSWLDLKISQNYPNISIVSDRHVARLLNEYRECDVVVVCLKPNIYSGITVALEAVSLGKPLVCSNTGGIPTYFDESEVTYIPVGDCGALRLAVETAVRDRDRVSKALTRFERSGYSSCDFVGRYAQLTEELIAASCGFKSDNCCR